MSEAKTDAVLNWKPTDEGVPFDFQIGADGDIVTEDFLDTAFLVSLFTDRRAEPHEVPSPQHRRGWVGDLENPEDPIGSTLWLLDQSRDKLETSAQAGDAASAALEWMVQDEIATSIAARAFIEKGVMKLKVDAKKPNAKSEGVLVTLWDKTGI